MWEYLEKKGLKHYRLKRGRGKSWEQQKRNFKKYKNEGGLFRLGKRIRVLGPPVCQEEQLWLLNKKTERKRLHTVQTEGRQVGRPRAACGTAWRVGSHHAQALYLTCKPASDSIIHML